MRIAIVTLGYPPIRHVSGTRASEMARELCRAGDDVTVVTVDWRPNSGAPDVIENGVRVLRVNPVEWFPEFNPAARPIRIEREPRPLIRRIRTGLRTLRWGQFAPWARRALDRLSAAHQREPFDVVWAIHGDDSSHEVAYRFHRQTGVPWVADFKDPWDLFHPRLTRPLQQVVTRRRLLTSHCLTETAEEQARQDRVTFDRRCHVIWTSYDDKRMAAATPRRSSDKFSLVYVGHLGSKHDRDALAATLGQVRSAAGPGTVEFHIYGHQSSDVRPFLVRQGAEDMLVCHDFLDSSDAYSVMRGADALVLMPMADQRTGLAVGVKELEYFASGSPVISIGRLLPEVDALARHLPSVARVSSPAEATQVVLEELDHFQRGRPSPRRSPVNPDVVAAHSWAAKGAALRSVLAEAAASRAMR